MRNGPKSYAISIVTTFAATPAIADDLASPVQPPSPPSFYVHAGANGSFPQTNAQPEGGGVFSAANIAIRPVYTLAVEAGYFLTPNIAIAFSSGLPPLEHLKATGFGLTTLYGSNLAGSVRSGLAMLLLQYHFSDFGPVQPYAGIGAGYLFNLGNVSDGILENVSVDQNFALIFQAGADFMLTPSWGLFLDAKKALFSTDAQGFLTSPYSFTVPIAVTRPVRAHLTLDPWIATAGITFKY
jgi:outer membrane protein